MVAMTIANVRVSHRFAPAEMLEKLAVPVEGPAGAGGQPGRGAGARSGTRGHLEGIICTDIPGEVRRRVLRAESRGLHAATPMTAVGQSLPQSDARVVDNRGMPTSSGIPETAPESRCATRVVLADDDVLLREGLASLLDRSGFDVVGQAGNGAELLALVRSVHPELAIIDIRMPPAQATEGLQAAQVIREELPGTAIIVLSAHVEVDEAMELLAGGEGLGYLLKSRVTDVAEFIETVGRITAGASVVDPSLVQELVRARRRRDPLDVLSPREREVLALMAEGASNAGIARRIYVTEGTVEKHVRSILTKLDLPESDTEHRRVLAVLRFLEAR
jgi:DNA-binding NarL/FixJ family response regulator